MRTALLEKSIPTGPEARPLQTFLFDATALSDSAYADNVDALPQPFMRFPDVAERAKRRILISRRKITLTKASLDDLAEDAELQVLFVSTNIESYLEEPDNLALDDDFLESLLKAEISDERKASVIDFMDIDAVVGLPDRAALLGPILDRTSSSLSNVNANVARA